jgi:hypothetical protein
MFYGERVYRSLVLGFWFTVTFRVGRLDAALMGSSRSIASLALTLSCSQIGITMPTALITDWGSRTPKLWLLRFAR